MAIDFSNITMEDKDLLESNKVYKKMGRKPKKEEDKKTEKVCIYLTKEEKKLLTNKSYDNHMDISSFCKLRILAE